jgi:hypothetical protein
MLHCLIAVTKPALKFIYRFDGVAVAPEPREWVRSRHIPATKSVPFPEVGIVYIKKLMLFGFS